jgi:hypothetical protein
LVLAIPERPQIGKMLTKLQIKAIRTDCLLRSVYLSKSIL